MHHIAWEENGNNFKHTYNIVIYHSQKSHSYHQSFLLAQLCCQIAIPSVYLKHKNYTCN